MTFEEIAGFKVRIDEMMKEVLSQKVVNFGVWKDVKRAQYVIEDKLKTGEF